MIPISYISLESITLLLVCVLVCLCLCVWEGDTVREIYQRAQVCACAHTDIRVRHRMRVCVLTFVCKGENGTNGRTSFLLLPSWLSASSALCKYRNSAYTIKMSAQACLSLLHYIFILLSAASDFKSYGWIYEWKADRWMNPRWIDWTFDMHKRSVSESLALTLFSISIQAILWSCSLSHVASCISAPFSRWKQHCENGVEKDGRWQEGTAWDSSKDEPDLAHSAKKLLIH